MPKGSKKMKEMGYKSGYAMKPYQMDDPNMMKPYQMGHSPKKMGHSPKQMDHAMKMKHSPMPMKSPYNMKPGILRHMKGN